MLEVGLNLGTLTQKPMFLTASYITTSLTLGVSYFLHLGFLTSEDFCTHCMSSLLQRSLQLLILSQQSCEVDRSKLLDQVTHLVNGRVRV